MGTTSISISVLLLAVLWTPAYSNKCSIACTGSSPSKSFAPGQTYRYDVDGTVSVYLAGADKQDTSVKILGQVSVSSAGNCAMVLKVNNLAISGPDGKKYPAPKGIDKAVMFSYENGRVGAEICAEEDDHRPSLNIKRSIISMLQAEQKSSTQVDVFGACPTDVSSSHEGSRVLLHRTRDLSRCAHREQTRSELITAVYNPTAEIKNTQILRSVLNVEGKFDNGIPEKISAVEEYLYRPFSVGENGARAQVNTKLSLSGTSAGELKADCPEPRTIIFENPHNARAEHSSAQDVLAAVKETCKTLGNGATPKSAGLFAQLVRIMRSANKEDLMKVFGQVKGNNLEKRVFIDGLLRTGTGYSIDASINILKSKALNTIEQNLVFLSLGNAKHVNNEAIKAASGLLDIPDIPKNVYLGVGALAGIYCRDHHCHHEKNEGITALSKKFAAKLGNCKPKTKTEEDTVVAVLKGIRNIRHLEDSLIDKLVHCANDNGVKARVRVNALEAFLADPCSTKIKKTALDIMKNRNLDSEIRIKAFLAVIGCPCGKSATEIKNLLDSEPVHQVGRFISSSLAFIRSSSNPDKQHARQHYGNIGIPKKFRVDDRKYSFYRELSFNVDVLGVGGDLDETVIYSQDSFLPRSVTLNLTTEVFGHSVNLLEVGGRQGNLDRVVEHFLGPKSFLRTKNPQDLHDEFARKVSESMQKVEGSVRGRRSIKSDVDNIDKQIKAESNSFHNELDLDIYIKLFGTDAVFLSLGDDKGFDFSHWLDEALKMFNSGLDEMKRFQHDFRSHVLFLDAELAYPTSAGLPLKLDFVGSATGRLDIASSVDIRQILRNPENAKVDIKLVPSTDVEVSLVMMVDADCMATGLKVTNNLHSSTGSHVIAKIIENGQGFDLQWGLPVDKQEILTASNEMVFFNAEKGKPEKHIPVKVESEKKEYTACFDQLAGMIGLNLCGEISLPFTVSGPKAQESISKFVAKWPLVGPSKIKLVLEKNDLRGYHVRGVLPSDAKNGKYGIELLFEAEGSQNRKTHLTGELINNDQEKTVKLNIESPLKNLYNQISLYTKPNEYALMVEAKLDDAHYYLRAGLDINGNDKRKVMKPVVEYQVPSDKGKQNVKVEGQIIREDNGNAKKYTMQGVKLNLPNSPTVIVCDGHFATDPKGVEMDLKINQGQQRVLLSGALKDHDVKIEFQNTINPYINFKVNGHFENSDNIAHNDVELWYGGDLRSAENCVIFNQLIKRSGSSDKDFNVISKNKFEIRALPAKAALDFEVDPKKFDFGLEGNYVDRRAQLNIEARRNIKKEGDYRVKTNIALDRQAVEALVKRDVVSNEKSNLENYIDFKGIGRYELSGVVLHKIKSNDINVGAVGHLKVSGSGKDEDIKFDIGGIDNSNLYSAHATVASKSGQLIDFLLKLNRGASPNGQLKLALRDNIEANGKFQMNEKDGKGTGNIMVHFNKIQRVIKGETKFVVKDPVYNAEVDLFLNFDKDNNDKMHFSTSNKKTDKLIDSKNKFQYAGKTTEVNIHKDGVIAPVGKVHSNIEIVLPTERCLTLKVDRELTEKNNILNGHIDFEVADAEKRGAAASLIKLQHKLQDTDYDNLKLNSEGQLEFKLKDGRNIVSTYSYKNSPKGDKKYEVDIKNEVAGSLIPKKASLDVSGTYTTEWDDTDDHLRGKLSYGDDLAVEFVSNEIEKLPSKGEQKISSDFVWTVRLPLEKAHDIKWSSKILYVEPENQDIELTLMESLQVNSDLYKLESTGKFGTTKGSSKLKAVVPHVEPVIVDFDYKVDTQGEKKSGNVEVKAQYGKGRVSNVNVQAAFSPQESQLKVISNSPHYENLKALTVSYHAKTPTPDSYNVQLAIDADGRVYRTDTIAVMSKSQPLFDTKYYSPSIPKGARIFFKGNDIGNNHGAIEMKLENCKGYDFSVNAEGGFDKELAFQLKADCEKLGLKNYKMNIVSKDAGNGKRLEFNAENKNKNVLSGSTSFISKQEGPKTIIEGSGSLKIEDKQKPASFKYIRTFLTEGNEQGIETFMNVAVGDLNHVVESRITNMEYKGSYVYCEEKKQCAHAEINSKIVTSKPGSIQQVLNIGVDLRKLGFPTEFGLQSTSEYSEKRLPQHELNVHVNRDHDKIHLHAYSQPEFGKFPAGVTIALPHRVLAAESLVQFPVDKALPFPIRAEFSLYPDKNKPATKTGARLNIDASHNRDEAGEITAVLGFTHPKLGKEAQIKAHAQFKLPKDVLIVESSVVASHQTLGKDREAKFWLEAGPTHVKLMINTPIVKVIELEGSTTVKDNLQQADLKMSLLEGKPVQVYAVAKDFKYYEFSTSYSDQADRKLSLVANLDPEKRVDVSAAIVFPGQKKNIVNAALFIEDGALKTDYGVSNDNFQYFVKALRQDLDALQSRVKDISQKGSNEFKAILKRIEPTFKQISQAYREDFEKLVQEITNDTTLKELSEALHSLIKIMARIIDDVTNALQPIVDKIVDAITDASKKICDMYEKQIEPQILELRNKIMEVVKHYVDGVLDVAAHFGALVIDFVEKHKPELQELTNIFTEIFRDLTRILVNQMKEWKKKSAEFFAAVSENFSKIPIFDVIKEKWQELAVPEQIMGLLSEGKQTIREILPTEESKAFLDALFNYAQKKVHQEKVDEIAELKNLYEKMISAVNSLVTFVRGQLGQYGVPIYPAFNIASFIGGSPISPPSLGGSISFNIITQILRGDVPDPLSLINAYRPRSLNPLDEVPYKLRSVVVNGQHIFTFDGRHLTFPGTCRYVLAHDHVDRNFTLLIQLANGSPKALILEDKSGATIELKENGQVALNGAGHGYPVIEKDVFAFRQTNGRIGLGSTYGLMAFCTSKLEVCYIEISGFYLGKLRGLLGDGNNEPYDDFRMPNGKITQSEAEFGHSYRLTGSCAQPKTPEHSHAQHHEAMPAACETVFGGLSPLRPLSLFLDVHPFRQACIHACTGSDNDLHQACDLARGYAALALTGLLPAVLPAACVRCTDADKPREVGDIYEVKLPAKQADIVVSVEVTKSNEDNYKHIVVPLVAQVIDQLKAKRITDVKVYLVGVTSKYPYPIIYDTDLKLTKPKVVFDDESRYNDITPIHTPDKLVNQAQLIVSNLHNLLSRTLGTYNVMSTYESLSDLPLRPAAVKHFISAVGDDCEATDIPLKTLQLLPYRVWAENNGVTGSMVIDTPRLSTKDGKPAHNVLGFTKNSVLYADKKAAEGEEAREQLVVPGYNECMAFEEVTGGVIFSASNMKQASNHKQWLTSMATSITTRLLHESLVQECTCTYVDPFRVRSVCVTKDRKEVARRRK
ncbi:apolipophorins [Aricia agestis]|uniref:apolipophorins n=1 Tax=Aricia agestis TaxID=91739 RepID=UPI001C208D9A|nr:apolipophorins [Aricia agestis]